MTSSASNVVRGRRLQLVLALIAALHPTSAWYPRQFTPTDHEHFDFIVVGGGTAGCTLASRLTERSDLRVLLVEAGGDPAIESELPGLLIAAPHSRVDWNFTTAEDALTARRHSEHVLELTQGHVLGGSSAINLMLYIRGAAQDYNKWAAIVRDSVWDWPHVLPYFIKSEQLLDPQLLGDPFYGKAHGKHGPVAVTRQDQVESVPILQAFAELGHTIVPDINAGDSRGYTQPMFNIAHGQRSHAAYAYLIPIRDRSNLYVLRGALVTKVLIDENNVAIGIQCETENKINLNIFADREVILSAGALKTPQLLMLSGIGPADYLKPLHIPVLVNHPDVGNNLQDHSAVILLHRLPKAHARPAPPATEYPATLVLGFTAFDKSMEQPDYQSVSFLLPKRSGLGVSTCAVSFGFKREVCDLIGEAGRDAVTLLTTHHLLHPQSRGRVQLRSANPHDAPLVSHGIYSDLNDLNNEALYLKDFSRIVNTTYFRSVDAEMVDLNNCGQVNAAGSFDFWRCYALQMMTTTWHYSGTCALGSVVDARLRVRGVRRLRVVDASVMPAIPGGNTHAPTIMIAELAADLIKMDHF